MTSDTSTTIYKLLTEARTSFAGCHWTPGEWKETSGEGKLCGHGWLHGYIHPLLAVLHNPIHGDYPEPILWLAEARGHRLDDGQMKSGWTVMRILEVLPLPQISLEHRIRYAIYCAWTSSHTHSAVVQDWRAWAQGWVRGQDRSAHAAAAAAVTAVASVGAAKVAAEASAGVAKVAAEASAGVAWAAAEAAWVAEVAAADASWVATAVAGAAGVAEVAAWAAAVAGSPIDLVRAAQWAMSESVTLQ